MNTKPITAEEANKARNALLRLNALNESKIITKDGDAEKRMVSDFLNKFVGAHVNELLGCWFVMHYEFEPLLGALAPIVARLTPAQQQQPCMCSNTSSDVVKSDEPANVVQLAPPQPQ